MADPDTIFALATAPGRSALSLLRISGPAARSTIRALTGRECAAPRTAVVRHLTDPHTGVKIDDAVVTFFAGPNSFTGEDCAEFSLHGGRAVVSAMMSALSNFEGLRGAEPGEFTKRAFLHGKLDLSQAEAIADLIDSETEFQRRQALRILDGALSRMVGDWRAAILGIAAELESALDFNDEADVSDIQATSLIAVCQRLESEMAAELRASAGATALRDGFTVVIGGPPNVGKSSLFNALMRREAAIVTDVPGTTRDLIVGKLDLGGAPIILIDSAGIRDTEDQVERIGVERARTAANTADLLLWLNCGDAEAQPDGVDCPVMRVASKCDILAPVAEDLAISVHEAHTIDRLMGAIGQAALDAVGDGSQGSLIRERHKSALSSCCSALERLRGNLGYGLVELAAEDCRYAGREIGRICGEIGAEEILGEIFQRFCIGK